MFFTGLAGQSTRPSAQPATSVALATPACSLQQRAVSRQGLARWARPWALPVVLAASLVGGAASARQADPSTTLPPVALATLPKEAQTTYRLIHSGGPFPYDKDGVVFRNRERLLPLQPRGHYREYTVRTPGAKNRGARRIVCGGIPPTQPDACYYTSDHYASFSRIVP